MQPQVLLIEDDRWTSRELSVELGRFSTVVTVPTAEEGLAELAKHRFNVIIVDITPAGFTSGGYLIRQIASAHDRRRPLVIATVDPDDSGFFRIDKTAVQAIFMKPYNGRALAEFVRIAAVHSRTLDFELKIGQQQTTAEE